MTKRYGFAFLTYDLTVVWAWHSSLADTLRGSEALHAMGVTAQGLIVAEGQSNRQSHTDHLIR